MNDKRKSSGGRAGRPRKPRPAPEGSGYLVPAVSQARGGRGRHGRASTVWLLVALLLAVVGDVVLHETLAGHWPMTWLLAAGVLLGWAVGCVVVAVRGMCR